MSSHALSSLLFYIGNSINKHSVSWELDLSSPREKNLCVSLYTLNVKNGNFRWSETSLLLRKGNLEYKQEADTVFFYVWITYPRKSIKHLSYFKINIALFFF